MKVLFAILIFTSAFLAQSEKCACAKKDELKVREYFEKITARNKLIYECNQKYLVSLPDNVKILPKTISHLSPFAVSLVKPYFPTFARQHKISGAVDVKIIFDEQGFVIYAKAVRGNKVFYKSAEKAACASRISPVRYCEKFVKQQRIIRYEFIF